jgi:hypothetical protein|nr:hypothetical protein [Kofleriaceae bacterium]
MLKRTALVVTLLAGATPALAQTPPPDQNPSGGDQTPPTPPTPPDAPAAPTAPAAPAAPDAPPHMAPVPNEPPPPPPPEAAHPMVHSKWDATLYGFVEADSMYDSTQGLFESIGNGALPRPHTYAGDHGQMTYGARNSRFGIRLKAPEFDHIKPSAQLEMDFLGNQPGKPFDATGLVGEGAFFQNATVRYRHLNVKLETPVVDLLFGQYWELFGWQSYFHPSTVEIQGIPGQVYSRTPQIRISKTIKSDAGVTVDLAIAALRPPERASATPDGQAGLKIAFDKLKAWHTAGSTGTALDSAAVGVSVVGRRFAEDEFAAKPSNQVTTDGYGLAVDVLIPIIPATKESHANALTITGEFAQGAGIADLYTGLNFGVAQPTLPNPGMANPAPTYTPDVDNGLAMFRPNGELLAVKVQSYNVGVQYYLPPSGRAFVSLVYADINSPNSIDFGSHAKNWKDESYLTGSLFFDVTPAVRLGLEESLYDMTFNDNVEAKNYRTQFSAFFIF